MAQPQPKVAETHEAISNSTRTGEATHRTHNATKSNAKKVSIELLNARLADGIDLALITKQAHWNLKGLQFIGVHEMLDRFRTEQDDFNDKMAERAVMLGGTAYGTSQVVTGKSNLPPYPTNIYAIVDHLKELIDRYAVVANAVREAIDQTDEAGDADTADLFTEVSRGLDMQLWFLEAHMGEPSNPNHREL